MRLQFSIWDDFCMCNRHVMQLVMRSGFIIILLVFFGLVGYTTWHLWHITPGGQAPKLVVAGLFLVWMVAAFSSMLLRNRLPYPAVVALYEAGQPWLIAFAYLLIVFILADIATLCKLLPKSFTNGSLIGLLSIVGIVAAVMIAGGVHYRHKYREELAIQTEKPLEQQHIKVVMASDLHIGYSNRKAELARWVDMINAEHPDLVLFGGDIVDIQTEPLFEGNYADEFRRLEAPAYAVLGNHEYIAGSEDSEKFLKEAGITVLKDSVAHFKGIDIIGRDDRSNPGRPALKEYAYSLDGFTILLDHQPSHLEEAEEAGINFQFSGHTHRGQAWPISWITDAIFEKSWGPYQKGCTQYYISSGLGIWGPKIRIGTRSEYFVLDINSTSTMFPAFHLRKE